jgi:polygalacturonase
MRGVANPIAISPYYTNQTTEGFVDPHYTGDKIPDYKNILIQDVWALTPGDVLIAGIDDGHQTEVRLDNVVVKDILRIQLHTAHAKISVGPGLTNLPLPVPGHAGYTYNQFTPAAPKQPDACANGFPPMQ